MDFFNLRFDSLSSSLFFKDNQKLDRFKIYAHENELLIDHIKKVVYIFNNLKDDTVFLKFYESFYNKSLLNVSYEKFMLIFEDFLFFHDIGKISFNFQINRLNKNNSIIRDKQKNFAQKYNIDINIFEANHSLSGALTFLSKHKSLIYENKLFLILLAFSIYGHHTYLKDVLSEEDFTFNDFTYKDLNTLSSLLLFLDIAKLDEIENQEYDQIFFQKLQMLIDYDKTPEESTFSFFYNYIYSLLISSDVLATIFYNKSFYYVSKINFNNRITNKLKSKMIDSYYKVEYNKNLTNAKYTKNLNQIHDINDLRRNMLLESSFNLMKNLKSKNHNNLFFLNMPTGGGKTNTSMRLALDLIENTNANRIIYAMPFINIIEQNYDIICNNFNLSEENSEIRKIYSATETIFNEKNDEFKSKIITQDNFFNYPVICTTFSTLFESILRTKKGYKYKVSSLCNSVIILDEIQSLPLINWNSLYYLINEMAIKYNIYFIIMSATLPQFHKLKFDQNNNYTYNNAIQLISSPESYFNHYLFDRTKINGQIKELSIHDEKNLKEYLLNIIKNNFDIGYNKGLIVLNTIKSSKLIYDLLNECGEYDIDLLNSSLLSNVKQRIIYKINNMKKDYSKKYILVSTQSIEAGVDVSFDFVIRDFSILDSIEQVRGRCNRSRELNKFDQYRKGNIYLINLKDKRNYLHKYIYDFHEINSRILETSNLLKRNVNYKYEDILDYYDSVSNNINKLEDDKERKFIINDRNNIVNWNNMEYSKLKENDGIHIINNNFNQYSVFIPINMNIFNENPEKLDINSISNNELMELYNKNKNNFIFSLNELTFIKKIEENDNIFLIENNCVNGEKLVNYYEDTILNYNKNINELKIIRKEFSSILNKFIVNLSINNDEITDKIKFEFRKLSYFYIMDIDYIGDNDDSLYSLKRGLNFYPVITEIL